jgi:methylated-DNA-[protein]-cysteine S-methyltransferase
MYYSMSCASPVGALTIACDHNEESLVGLWMEGQRYHGSALGWEMRGKSGVPLLEAAEEWLDRYFAGDAPDISELPLSPAGSEFRREVWRIIRDIPYGEVITYGDIAAKTAAFARAVGGAVGHNPISILIPCHRVVGSGGSLTGYAGGIDRKIKLLELEGVDMSRFFIPERRERAPRVSQPASGPLHPSPFAT